jgi:hypothetical protein
MMPTCGNPHRRTRLRACDRAPMKLNGRVRPRRSLTSVGARRPRLSVVGSILRDDSVPTAWTLVNSIRRRASSIRWMLMERRHARPRRRPSHARGSLEIPRYRDPVRRGRPMPRDPASDDLTRMRHMPDAAVEALTLQGGAGDRTAGCTTGPSSIASRRSAKPQPGVAGGRTPARPCPSSRSWDAPPLGTRLLDRSALNALRPVLDAGKAPPP